MEHDDVIKWKHFPRCWLFVRRIHRSPVNSPYKGQWRGALMFSLICVWINGWVNNRDAGDLMRYRAHYDVIIMEEYVHPIETCESNYSSMPWYHINYVNKRGTGYHIELSTHWFLGDKQPQPLLYRYHRTILKEIIDLSLFKETLNWKVNPVSLSSSFTETLQPNQIKTLQIIHGDP